MKGAPAWYREARQRAGGSAASRTPPCAGHARSRSNKLTGNTRLRARATPHRDIRCSGARLAGDGYVPVYGGRVAERGEHAGGQVGARDGESVGQVAVDRGAVSTGGGFVEIGRASCRERGEVAVGAGSVS